jgi:serine/threonine protein kinase
MPPISDNGPETVMSPGQREISSGTQPANRPDSAIVNRLFPPEYLPDNDSPLDEPAGAQLGHFVIESKIGTGGMGSVFQAKDTRLDRIVALKVLTPTQSCDLSAIQRFQNEAQSAARMDHENIARVHYFGEDNGLHFIAYEFISGINVREQIRQRGQLNPGEAVNFTSQIASALNHMSSEGVVHRDIKPSNIIITPNGRAKLVDLGLARKQSVDESQELTTAGTTLGTFDYISPEQAKDPRNVDVRSDIYSLGCTLYHMLTGEPPYPEGTVLQKLLDHQGTDPPNPCRKNRSVPLALGAAVQKMMASDLRTRYATPDDLIRDLMPFVGKMVLRDLGSAGLVWASPESKGSRFWEKHLGWMITVAVLLLIVFFIDRFSGGLTDEITKNEGPGFGGKNSIPNHNPVPNTGKNQIFDPSQEYPLQLSPPTLFDGEQDVQPFIPLLSKNDLLPTRDPIRESSITKILPPVEALKPAGWNIESSPPDNPQPTVLIVSAGGDVKSYQTLEAACRDSNDGDVIKLNTNGRLLVSADKPLKVTNKEITILAGKDRDGKSYRPLIEFVAGSISESEDIRMLTLVDGSVNFINVDLKMDTSSTSEAGATGKWTFFRSHGADTVRIDNAVLTVVNPGPKSLPAAVFELASQPASSRSNTMMMNNDQGDELRGFRFEIVGSFVRGGCDLFSGRYARPGRMKIENSVVAVERSLLNVIGDEQNEPPENSTLELRLEHITCLVGNGLLKVHSGDDGLAGNLIPLDVTTARNNIFATKTDSPLVSMTGTSDIQDFKRILNWNGSRNYYGPFDMYWLIKRDPTAEPVLALDYHRWKRFWGRSDQETGLLETRVVWIQKKRWQRKLFSKITPTDIELEPDADVNPAFLGADDGSDAGADLTHFDDFFPQEKLSNVDE